jgi:hypothetical protein
MSGTIFGHLVTATSLAAEEEDRLIMPSGQLRCKEHFAVRTGMGIA